jgi:DNA-binding GntR family transcriptional regulator
VTEKTVTEMFHLGRTPLREALRQLETEGYIDVFPNRGAVVRKISMRELEQVYDLLAVLEGYAVESSARCIDPSGVEKLRGIEKELITAARAENYAKWLDKNVLFHTYFQEVLGNKLLSDHINNLRRRTYRYRALSVSIPGHMEEYLADHRKILDAVVERKAEKAGKAMRGHVERAKNILVKFLNENPWV